MIGQMLVTRILPGILGILASLRFGLGLYAWNLSNKLEKPVSTVIQKLGHGVELRHYDAYTVAECTFKRPETMKAATSGGFRKVAGYIFGKNRVKGREAAQKMAMTAPVRMELKGDIGPDASLEQVKVSFVMASNYTVKNLPVPLDSDVKLRKIAPHNMAVVAFRGPPPTDRKVEQMRKLVLAELAGSNTAPANDDTLVYGYHDPFITPNFLRRNEVGLMVA